MAMSNNCFRQDTDLYRELLQQSTTTITVTFQNSRDRDRETCDNKSNKITVLAFDSSEQ